MLAAVDMNRNGRKVTFFAQQQPSPVTVCTIWSSCWHSEDARFGRSYLTLASRANKCICAHVLVWELSYSYSLSPSVYPFVLLQQDYLSELIRLHFSTPSPKYLVGKLFPKGIFLISGYFKIELKALAKRNSMKWYFNGMQQYSVAGHLSGEPCGRTSLFVRVRCAPVLQECDCWLFILKSCTLLPSLNHRVSGKWWCALEKACMIIQD